MFGDPFENPKGYVKKTIGDVCDFQGGSQPPRKEFVFKPQEGYVRLIQIRDYKTDDYITYAPEKMCRRFCDADDIMIGRYGPPIFQILQGIEGAYNVALMKAIPHGINKEFMRAYLKRDELLHHLELFSTRTAGQSGIEMSELRGYPCLVPPEEEQLQYVEFVKQSDKSKFVRFKSQFIEMFGELDKNTKQFPVRKLNEISSYWNGLTYKPADAVKDGTGTLVLRSSNIQNGALAFEDNVYVNCEIKEKLFVQDNDILMCSRNGSAALVGKTALIKGLVEPTTFGAFMMIIRSEYYSYLRTYFETPFFRSQISTGTSTINQITGKMLNDISLPVPDMDTVRKFESFVHQSDKSKFELKEAIKSCDALMKAILFTNLEEKEG